MAEKLKNRHTKKQFHCLTSLDSLLWSSTKTAQLTGLASFFFISLQTEPHKIPELYKSQQIFRSESWFQKKQLGYNWELSFLMLCQSSRSHFRRLQPSSGRNRLRACGPNHKSQEFSCPANHCWWLVPACIVTWNLEKNEKKNKLTKTIQDLYIDRFKVW